MSVENWAKLFTPFSALHGFDIESLTKEQDRLLVPQAALSADQQDSIWRTLNGLQRGKRITVTCFVPVKRWGEQLLGDYTVASGAVKKVDSVEQLLMLEQSSFPFENIQPPAVQGVNVNEKVNQALMKK